MCISSEINNGFDLAIISSSLIRNHRFWKMCLPTVVSRIRFYWKNHECLLEKQGWYVYLLLHQRGCYSHPWKLNLGAKKQFGSSLWGVPTLGC